MFEKVDEFELTQEQYVAFLIENIRNMKKVWDGEEEFSYLPKTKFRLAFMLAGSLDEEPEEIRQAIKNEFPVLIEDCKELMQDTARALREFDWLPKELP